MSPKPRYPKRSIDLAQEGTAIVLLIIDENGLVSEAKLKRSSGHTLLDRAAIRTLLTWRFRGGPGTYEKEVIFELRSR